MTPALTSPVAAIAALALGLGPVAELRPGVLTHAMHAAPGRGKPVPKGHGDAPMGGCHAGLLCGRGSEEDEG